MQVTLSWEESAMLRMKGCYWKAHDHGVQMYFFPLVARSHALQAAVNESMI